MTWIVETCPHDLNTGLVFIQIPAVFGWFQIFSVFRATNYACQGYTAGLVQWAHLWYNGDLNTGLLIRPRTWMSGDLNVRDLNVWGPECPSWDLNVWDPNVRDLNVRDLKILAPKNTPFLFKHWILFVRYSKTSWILDHLWTKLVSTIHILCMTGITIPISV